MRLRLRLTTPAIPCMRARLLTLLLCVRRHVALRRQTQHASPAAVRSWPPRTLHVSSPTTRRADRANAACVRRQMLLYMALAPEEKLSAPHCGSNAPPPSPLPHPPHPPLPTLCLRPLLSLAAYKEGGPAAEARFEEGVAGFEARAFRGCGIFTSEPFG